MDEKNRSGMEQWTGSGREQQQCETCVNLWTQNSKKWKKWKDVCGKDSKIQVKVQKFKVVTNYFTVWEIKKGLGNFWTIFDAPGVSDQTQNCNLCT